MSSSWEEGRMKIKDSKYRMTMGGAFECFLAAKREALNGNQKGAMDFLDAAIAEYKMAEDAAGNRRAGNIVKGAKEMRELCEEAKSVFFDRFDRLSEEDIERLMALSAY